QMSEEVPAGGGNALEAPAAPPAAEGYLQKRSRILHRWERVYCRLLDGGRLAYASEPPNGESTASDWAVKRAKCLQLSACTIRPLAGRERAFEILTGDGRQTVALSAESDEDLDMWMSAFLVARAERRGGSGANSNTGCSVQ
ncbi:hypothetical protein BOX15_Mlig017139g4, partial [Macrostomum lignano]